MKKIKVLAVILTLIMSIGLLSSCGKKAETETPATTAPATTAPATTTAAATTESVYKDGIYKVAFDNFDKNGWKGQVELEIKGDKITNVVFDYVNKDGKLKTQDEAYKKAMEPVTKTYPAKFIPELQQSLLDKQDIAAVDAVAGATGSSNNFKALAGAALDMAKTGDTAPKTIPTPAE
jgi:major membrane immunogen (membrane-anchored lipoprotein)